MEMQVLMQYKTEPEQEPKNLGHGEWEVLAWVSKAAEIKNNFKTAKDYSKVPFHRKLW